MTGPPTDKWAIVDVAHNDTRGSSQRLRKKREKIRVSNEITDIDSFSKSDLIDSFIWLIVCHGDLIILNSSIP